MTPTLPSVKAAAMFIRGEPGGILAVISSTLGRAAIIAPGLWVAGDRNPKRIARNALFGALAIEIFVLGAVARQIRADAPRNTLPPGTPPGAV